MAADRSATAPDAADSSARQMRPALLYAVIAALCLSRIAYGLTAQFWQADTLGEYLVGLRLHALGGWPHFGHFVLGRMPMPGAIEGLVAVIALNVWAAPESPLIAANLLTCAALVLLAWYGSRRLPSLPAWLVYAWVLLTPGTVMLSTRLLGASLLLVGAVLFFLGALETMPSTRAGVLGRHTANAMMGAGLLWTLQVYPAWPVLLVFLLASILFQLREQRGRDLAWFLAGAAPLWALLLPTYFYYGWLGSSFLAVEHSNRFDRIPENVAYAAIHPLTTVAITFRDWMRAPYPLTGTDGFFPFVWSESGCRAVARVFVRLELLLTLALFVLPRRWAAAHFPGVRTVTLLAIALLCLATALTGIFPYYHRVYVIAPLVILLTLYGCDALYRRPGGKAALLGVLLLWIAYHTAVAGWSYRHESLYVDRATVQRAIDERQPALLWKRFVELQEARP